MFLTIKRSPLFQTDLPNNKCCRTVSGDDVNKRCIFPFRTTDGMFYDCDVDEDVPWCSTKMDADGNHISGKGNWGNCGPECPMAGTLTYF